MTLGRCPLCIFCSRGTPHGFDCQPSLLPVSQATYSSESQFPRPWLTVRPYNPACFSPFPRQRSDGLRTWVPLKAIVECRNAFLTRSAEVNSSEECSYSRLIDVVSLNSKLEVNKAEERMNSAEIQCRMQERRTPLKAKAQ